MERNLACPVRLTSHRMSDRNSVQRDAPFREGVLDNRFDPSRNLVYSPSAPTLNAVSGEIGAKSAKRPRDEVPDNSSSSLPLSEVERWAIRSFRALRASQPRLLCTSKVAALMSELHVLLERWGNAQSDLSREKHGKGGVVGETSVINATRRLTSFLTRDFIGLFKDTQFHVLDNSILVHSQPFSRFEPCGFLAATVGFVVGKIATFASLFPFALCDTKPHSINAILSSVVDVLDVVALVSLENCSPKRQTESKGTPPFLWLSQKTERLMELFMDSLFNTVVATFDASSDTNVGLLVPFLAALGIQLCLAVSVGCQANQNIIILDCEDRLPAGDDSAPEILFEAQFISDLFGPRSSTENDLANSSCVCYESSRSVTTKLRVSVLNAVSRVLQQKKIPPPSLPTWKLSIPIQLSSLTIPHSKAASSLTFHTRNTQEHVDGSGMFKRETDALNAFLSLFA